MRDEIRRGDDKLDPEVGTPRPRRSVSRGVAQVAGIAIWAGLGWLLASPLVAGESPWYVAARYGEARASRDFGPPIFGWTVDESDRLAAVDVGYAAHRFLSFEAGYADFGSYLGNPRSCGPGDPCPLAGIDPLLLPQSLAEVELRGYSLSAVPRWPVTRRAALYGKVGWLHWQADLTRPGDRARLGDASSDELSLGAGAEYRFPGGLGLLVEYDASDLLEAVTLGASWRF